MRGFTIKRGSGSRRVVTPKVDRFRRTQPKQQSPSREASGASYLRTILGMIPDQDRPFRNRALDLVVR